MSKDFLTSVIERRSFYGIAKESPISDDRIKEIIEIAVKYAPSALNSQSTRVVLLLDIHHDRLWEITKEALRKIVPAQQFVGTEQKINSFANGYGTVLFFEEQQVIESLQQQYAIYKDNFPGWSLQANGMNQFIVWTALENEGFGASLQHYNELIEQQIKEEWSIAPTWKLISQMPFGKPIFSPSKKTFEPLETRVKVFK